MATTTNRKYDLEERTAKFGENIIVFAKKVPKDTVTMPIISQLIRAGTSPGANYREANNASSKKDFRNKIYICKKETSETKYWLRMLNKAIPEMGKEIKDLYLEAQELNLIFQKIVSSLNKKQDVV